MVGAPESPADPPQPPIDEREGQPRTIGAREVQAGPLRLVYLGIGFVFVGLGALGVILPGLPTTPFMLLAAWMFSKSSPRFHAWLWNHRVFGPYVQNWARHRVIPAHAKVLSTGFMAGGLVFMVYREVPWPVVLGVFAVCVYGTIFILRRPSRVPTRGPVFAPTSES